jgi:aerobic carbon-monoxide dehydrogenase medium subunit
MKAPRFQYIRAQSRADALDLLAQHKGEARILAGGQSLMPMLNMRLASPSILVDINALTELAGITLLGGMVRIGAMTRHREVAESTLVREHLPLITDAMRHVAHPAIRNRGTFGGSLATADPCAEMPACCLVLGARMVAESVRGQRTIGANDFFRGIFETALEPDELLVAVEVPIPDSSWRPSFMEFARRHGDYAIVGAAAQAQLDGARLSDIRLVLFGVDDRAIRVRSAEQALLGSASGAQAIAAAQSALSDELSPSSDNHASAQMRLHYARVLIERTVRRLGVS